MKAFTLVEITEFNYFNFVVFLFTINPIRGVTENLYFRNKILKRNLCLI